MPRCIDSVLNQSYRNLEIFLVDDGSPDRCGEICDAYAEKDGRIRVIHKKNGGLSDARNAALDICTGEYISFVDSDDYISKDFIETLYQAIKTHHTFLAVCGIMKFDDAGLISTDYAPSTTLKCVTGYEMIETIWRPAACNKLYHRSLFDGIRFPVGKLYEDLFIYHDILAKIDQISLTGKNSYYYFNRQSSIMNKEYDIRNVDLIEGLDLRIRKLREMRFNEHADQQLLFVFNSTVEAYRKLGDEHGFVEDRLKEVKTICNRHFGEMMAYHGLSVSQKARIALFRFIPGAYLRLFKTGL